MWRAEQRTNSIALISLILAATARKTSSWQRDYNGSQVFRIYLSPEQTWPGIYTKLQQVSTSPMDIWQYSPTDGAVDVRIHGSDVISTEKLLTDLRLNYHVTVNDVSSLVTEEQNSNGRRRRCKRSLVDNDIIGYYEKYDEILSWIDKVSRRYPAVTMVIDIGMTSERRPMKILKIGLPGRAKWKVWIDGGIHAREWISPATVLYLAQQLLEGYRRKDNTTTELLRNLDFYILPVANPDGYEFSHTKDRLWRKSRQRDVVTGCHGVDLNRNWRFQWGGSYSSDDPCDDVYRGNSPEDSLEVKNIVDFLSARAKSFLAFLTYHSYGQRFISRWDYSKEIVPNDHDELMELANKAVDAMFKVHGTVYEAGRAPELMYPYGGGSPDWAKAVAEIKYSYLIELRDDHSFILPASEIIPTGEENWAALRVLSQEIINGYGQIPAPEVSDHPDWSRDNQLLNRIRNNEYDENPELPPLNAASRVHSRRVHLLVYVFVFCWCMTCLDHQLIM